MTQWNPHLSDKENAKNEDLAKRIAEQLKGSGTYDDDCGCAASQVKLDYAALQEVTGTEWLIKIAERLNQSQILWTTCSICSQQICGSFANGGIGYKACIGISTYGDILDAVTRLSAGQCFQSIVIAEGNNAVLRYQPKRAEYTSQFTLIDTPELALGRDWLLWVAEQIRSQRSYGAYEPTQARQRAVEKSKHKTLGTIDRFFAKD